MPPKTEDSPSRKGLDGREPTILALALLLLGISGFLPWWGFAMDTSQIPYNSTEGTDFGPWVVEEWEFQIFPGATRRDSLTLAWWDFVILRPELADYALFAVVAGPLWIAAVLTAGTAFVFRARPRSRMKGWPTLLQVAAAASIAVGLAIAWGLPGIAGFPSFLGVAGPMSWGPKVGWLVGLASLGLLSLSAGLGWRTDRALKGLCWKCYHEVSGPVCSYCEAPQ